MSSSAPQPPPAGSVRISDVFTTTGRAIAAWGSRASATAGSSSYRDGPVGGLGRLHHGFRTCGGGSAPSAKVRRRRGPVEANATIPLQMQHQSAVARRPAGDRVLARSGSRSFASRDGRQAPCCLSVSCGGSATDPPASTGAELRSTPPTSRAGPHSLAELLARQSAGLLNCQFVYLLARQLDRWLACVPAIFGALRTPLPRR
jgi:hypothetical protein